MCFENNEHGFDNIIQKNSNVYLPNVSANIISFETIDHEPNVHSKKKWKFVITKYKKIQHSSNNYKKNLIENFIMKMIISKLILSKNDDIDNC